MLVSPTAPSGATQTSAHSPHKATFPRPLSFSRKSKTSSSSTASGTVGGGGGGSGGTISPFSRWRPSYHFIAPRNWMNDPCGPSFDPKTGLYHLFYEFNPKGSTWGNMSWMHATSTDLVTWKHVSDEPVIKPSTSFDGEGIFSGGVLAQGPNGEPDQMTAIYTAVSNLPIHWTRKYHWGCEKLALIVSSDGGRTWSHNEQSLILDSPPKDLEGKVISWRDPFIAAWPKMDELLGGGDGEEASSSDNLYGLISGGLRDQTPTAFLYKLKRSKLNEWSYIGTVADVGLNRELAKGYSGDMGRNWEVCNFFQINDITYLLMNVEGSGDDLKGRHAMWARCDVSVDTRTESTTGETSRTPVMTPRASCLFDHGCLYACTTFHNLKDGRRILWGWVPEDDLSEDRYEEQGWSGCMALPRELFHTTYDGVVGTFRGNSDPSSMAIFVIQEGSIPGTKKLSVLASRPVVETELLRSNAHFIDVPAQELASFSSSTLCSDKTTVALKGIHSRNVEMTCEMEIPSTAEGTTSEVGFVLAHNANMSRYVEVVYEPHKERITVRRAHSSSERGVNLEDVSAPFTLLRQLQQQHQQQQRRNGDAMSSSKLETLKWHILLDNSVLEVFVNDRCALTTRLYVDEDESCKGVSLLVNGSGGKVMVHETKAWVGLNRAMLDENTTTTTTAQLVSPPPPPSPFSSSSSSSSSTCSRL